MAKRGKFITFEGGEGSGKSTQIKRLSEFLTAQKIAHIITREPGGTPLAERIRPLLVEPLDNRSQSLQGTGSESVDEPSKNCEDWHPLAETLLFLAARVQHWQQKIAPALAAGQWVLCDRFMDSTLVYQGVGKKLGLQEMQQLHQHILPQVQPDITFLLDIDPKEGLQRASARGDHETRFESLDLSFHESLLRGFLQLAEAEKSRFKVIDATQSKEAIAAQVLSGLEIQ